MAELNLSIKALVLSLKAGSEGDVHLSTLHPQNMFWKAWKMSREIGVRGGLSIRLFARVDTLLFKVVGIKAYYFVHQHKVSHIGVLVWSKTRGANRNYVG